jgi:hypothetical protein
MFKNFLFAIIALISLPSLLMAQLSESINVTVYNNDLGVIKDVRSIDIPAGKSEIKITDVAERIDPTSVHIDLDGEVIEQNYRYDLASMYKILDRYIDKKITLAGEDVITGELLSVSSGQIVLRKDDGDLVMLPDYKEYRINVDKLPDGLITRPTLVWLVDSRSRGRQNVELAYQTSGMSWSAEYNLVLNSDDTRADLNSWVSIENKSGARYSEANLKLIAGDINLMKSRHAIDEVALTASGHKAPQRKQFEEQAFFEYHMYDLQRKTTLRNNETKQIALFDAKDIEITKKYKFTYRNDRNRKKENPTVRLEFENSESNNLGMPFPAGKVRMYKSDGEDVQLVGEDMIRHTPRNEKIELETGKAFDIVIDAEIKDRDKITDKTQELEIEVNIRNRKKENIVLDYKTGSGHDCDILEANYDFEKINAYNFLFRLPVEADSETKLKYTIRFSY